LADAGSIQLSLFDQANLAEIAHPDYPGERLVACRNPALAVERARKRDELLAATEALLEPIVAAVQAGRLTQPDKIGVRVGRAINRFKMAKHFDLDIRPQHFAFSRKVDQINAEAALDGIYVVRTTIAAADMEASGVVETYKRLANVERDFRSLKTVDLDLRPIHHHLADRVRAHVLICMLAAYLVWHLRKAWAPLCFTDEQLPQRVDPVAPAKRSAAAQAKASRQRTVDDQPVYDFATLLDHLATLTRNQLRAADNTFELVATPTPLQRRAFELLHAPVPYRLS